MGSPALPILTSVDAPSDVKAQAWDDYHTAFTPEQFKSKFDALDLPREAKAALWNAKFGDSQGVPAAAPVPAPPAPADPDALVPPSSPDEPAPAPAPQAPPAVQQPLPSRPSALSMPPKPVAPPNASPINQTATIGGPTPLDGNQQPAPGPAQKVPLKSTPAFNPNGPQAPPSADAPVPLPPQPAQVKPPDIYEQAKTVANTTPSFGSRLLAAKLGVQRPQAADLLDKMEAEGIVKKTKVPTREGVKIVYTKVSGSPFPPESAGRAPGAVTAAPGSASDDLLNGQQSASINLGGHPVVVQRQGSGQNFAIKDPAGQDIAGISIKRPGVGQEIKRLIGGQ